MTEIQARFDADTKDHEMTVAHDDGLYRHLQFRKPGTGFYWFDIITWPGSLTIRGDMGSYVFARETDMFAWFASSRRINPSYWSEKVQAVDTHSGVREYSPDAFRAAAFEAIDYAFGDGPEDVAQQAAVLAHFTETVLDDQDGFNPDFDYSTREGAEDAARTYEGPAGFRFTDIWEWELTEYSAQFLWCCTAILHGIRTYRAAQSTPALAEGVAS